MDPKNPSSYPFGLVTFSLPNRKTMTRDGTSEKVADVHVATTFGLQIVTAVWAKETPTATEFGVSLPRGLRAIADDPISAEIVERFKNETMSSYAVWRKTASEAQATKSLAPTAGKLVIPR